MYNQQIVFEAFPVHTSSDFQNYKYWNKKDLIIQSPVVYRNCTPNCYFDRCDLNSADQYCPNCYNSFKTDSLVFDIGFKKILTMYAKRLESQKPLFIKINPITKKVYIPKVKRSLEGELAFYMYKQIYQRYIFAVKVAAKNQPLNLEKIQKQISSCFNKNSSMKEQGHQKNKCFSFCRRPKRSDGTSQILLFYSDNPHEPIPYQIKWINDKGKPMNFQQQNKLNQNFNHNAFISMIQIEGVKHFVIGISTKSFQIFVSSLSNKHRCIDTNKRTLNFILAKDYEQKRQYPCQYTDHNRNRIYIIGGFEEETTTDRRQIRIVNIKWLQTEKFVKPIIDDQISNHFFSRIKTQRIHRGNSFQWHVYPVYRGFSMTYYSQHKSLKEKLDKIKKINQQKDPNMNWLTIGGEKLDEKFNLSLQSVTVQRTMIQAPSYKQITYVTNMKQYSRNPIADVGGINYTIDMSSIYPMVCDYPITGHKRDKKHTFNRSFLVKNSIKAKRGESKISVYLLIFQENGDISPAQLFSVKNQRVEQIQQNGDNFFCLLYDSREEGQFYLRGNLSLKKPYPSQNKNEKRQVQYYTFEYFYYRTEKHIFIKQGFVGPNTNHV